MLTQIRKRNVNITYQFTDHTMKDLYMTLVPVCLLLFYVLATMVKSGLVPTRDSVHSLRFYSAAPLGNQATSTMFRFPTQSHYSDTKPTSACPILITPST